MPLCKTSSKFIVPCDLANLAVSKPPDGQSETVFDDTPLVGQIQDRASVFDTAVVASWNCSIAWPVNPFLKLHHQYLFCLPSDVVNINVSATLA